MKKREKGGEGRRGGGGREMEQEGEREKALKVKESSAGGVMLP